MKWTDRPDAREARHLACFLGEYASAARGFLVCRTPRRMTLTDRVIALPWQELLDELDAL